MMLRGIRSRLLGLVLATVIPFTALIGGGLWTQWRSDQATAAERAVAEARLLAERDMSERIKFPPLLRSDPETAEIIASQTRIFDARRKLQSSRIEVIQRRKAQTEREINALGFQVEAATKRASIIKQEMATVGSMVAKGLQTRARLLQLEQLDRQLPKSKRQRENNKGRKDCVA